MSEVQFEEDNMREDFESAFEQLESDETTSDDDIDEEISPDDDEEATLSDDETTDDTDDDEDDLDEEDEGSTEDDGDQEDEDDGGTSSDTEDEEGEEDTARAEDEVDDEESEPPPAGWKATAREVWKDIPKAAKDEILRREKDVAVGLQRATDARKFAEQFQRTTEPFHRHMQAEGARNPLEAIEGLLNTAASLQDGTAREKAATVAQLISRYRVDIETLDDVLASGAGEHANQDAIDAAVRPYKQQLEQMQQTDRQFEEQQQEQMQKELEQFAASNEFYEDVREKMSELMIAAGNAGRAMTLEQAYEQACKLNDEVQSVLKRRDEIEQARKRKAVAKKKRRAAASIKARSSSSSRRRNTEPDNPNDDMRADIESAMKDG